MVLVTDKKYEMDEVLKTNLDYLNKAVKVKWDAPLIVDGVEGAGKTTLTDQICYYQAYTNKTVYNLNNVVFLPEQFEEFVDYALPFTPVNWDEAVFATMGEDWAKTINKTILKKWVTIRKKRLFINVCIPWIYLMRIYYAVGRTRALIHVYTPDGISRGKFKIYNYNEKRELYMKNKRNYSYDGIKPSYTNGNFIDTEGLFYSAKEYDDKKEEAIRSLNVNTKKEQKWKIRCLQLYELYETIGGKQDTLAEKWNVTQQYISEFKKELDNKTIDEIRHILIKNKFRMPTHE